MLDSELIAECVGIVKNSTAVTVGRVSDELEISLDKAEEILNQIEDCCLIVCFGGFYACTDLAELN